MDVPENSNKQESADFSGKDLANELTSESTATSSEDRIVEELAEGLTLPQEGSFGMKRVRNMAKEILWAETEPTLSSAQKEAAIKSAKWKAWRTIAEPVYEPKTPKEMRRWYPGGESHFGFLHWGEQLDEVIAKDEKTLEDLGIDSQQLGSDLKKLLDEAKNAVSERGPSSELDDTERAVEIGKYNVELRFWRGSQSCPFDGCAGPEQHDDEDFLLTNTETGEGISGPGLIAHLISEHSFFEGEKSMYRVDPRLLVSVLYGEHTDK